jgi:hypothetical protein
MPIQRMKGAEAADREVSAGTRRADTGDHGA